MWGEKNREREGARAGVAGGHQVAGFRSPTQTHCPGAASPAAFRPAAGATAGAAGDGDLDWPACPAGGRAPSCCCCRRRRRRCGRPVCGRPRGLTSRSRGLARRRPRSSACSSSSSTPLPLPPPPPPCQRPSSSLPPPWPPLQSKGPAAPPGPSALLPAPSAGAPGPGPGSGSGGAGLGRRRQSTRNRRGAARGGAPRGRPSATSIWRSAGGNVGRRGRKRGRKEQQEGGIQRRDQRNSTTGHQRSSQEVRPGSGGGLHNGGYRGWGQKRWLGWVGGVTW